jgi:hypothetical protein
MSKRRRLEFFSFCLKEKKFRIQNNLDQFKEKIRNYQEETKEFIGKWEERSREFIQTFLGQFNNKNVTGLWKETKKNIKRAISPHQTSSSDDGDDDNDGPNTPPSSTSSLSKNSPMRYSLRSTRSSNRNNNSRKHKQKAMLNVPLKHIESSSHKPTSAKKFKQADIHVTKPSSSRINVSGRSDQLDDDSDDNEIPLI